MKCAVYRKPPEFCQHHLFPCLMGVGSKEKKLYDHWKSNREQSEAEQTFKKTKMPDNLAELYFTYIFHYFTYNSNRFRGTTGRRSN